MEELKFSFTKDESQLILNALLDQRCGDVLNVVNKLQLQASEQMKESNKKT